MAVAQTIPESSKMGYPGKWKHGYQNLRPSVCPSCSILSHTQVSVALLGPANIVGAQGETIGSHADQPGAHARSSLFPDWHSDFKHHGLTRQRTKSKVPSMPSMFSQLFTGLAFFNICYCKFVPFTRVGFWESKIQA